MVELEPYTVNRQCTQPIFEKFSNIEISNEILELADNVCINDSIISLYIDTSIIDEIRGHIILPKITSIVNAEIEASETMIDVEEKTKKRTLLFLDAVNSYFSTTPQIFMDYTNVKSTFEIQNDISRIAVGSKCCIDINLIVKECDIHAETCHLIVTTEIYSRYK